MKVRIGIAGLGYFSDDFVKQFLLHPDVERVAVCDIVPDRVQASLEKHPKVNGAYYTYEEMLKDKDLNCVGIFTNRHYHAKMVLQALEAGKNVYSAVPFACSVEEVTAIVEKVKETGLTYMMGETCYYYPCAIYCREQYRKGEFGSFVYAESNYYHDICEMYTTFQHSGGEHWQMHAGLPPMFYPTHSVSMAFAAIDQYATKVSCFGLVDDFHDDNIYGEGKNFWDNPFSNETALFRMSGGGVVRVNEFRRVGINKPSSYITAFYGDKGSYECSVTKHTFQKGIAAGKATLEDIGELVNTLRYNNEMQGDGLVEPANSVRYITGFAKIQDRARLPKVMRELPPGGHYNTHSFLIDDFCRSIVDEQLPPCNAWAAARWMIPGLVAHESAMKGGILLDIPDLGDAPSNLKRMTFEKKDYYEI